VYRSCWKEIVMEALECILRHVRTIKEALDLDEEPPTLTNQLVQLKQQVAQLQSRLDESHKLSTEKDELIAELQAVAALKDNMIVDGPAYFVKKDGGALDGPFCTPCFGRGHETVRIIPAAKPKDGEGDKSEWVQCSKCKTPFRSQRLSEYLNPPQSVATTAPASKKTRPVRKPPARRKTRQLAAAKKAKSR
jgi:hypothetical protein